MRQKKRFSLISMNKKAQEESISTYKLIIMIILAIMLGLFLFMMVGRWSGAFHP